MTITLRDLQSMSSYFHYELRNWVLNNDDRRGAALKQMRVEDEELIARGGKVDLDPGSPGL